MRARVSHRLTAEKLPGRNWGMAGDVPPKLNPSVDIARLRLEPKEAFVLSRIDGATAPSALADLVGMKPAEIGPVLHKLARAGAIVWEGGGAALEDAKEEVPSEI